MLVVQFGELIARKKLRDVPWAKFATLAGMKEPSGKTALPPDARRAGRAGSLADTRGTSELPCWG
jgi:hypothetical protein